MLTVNDIRLTFISFTRVHVIDAEKDTTEYAGELIDLPEGLKTRRVWYCDVAPDRSITIMLMPE